MDSYLPVDVTEQGKALCVAGTPDGAAAETVHEPLDTRRCVVPHSLRALRDAKIYTTATKQLSFKGAGDDGNIDLAACYQIVGESQIRAIGRCLQFVFDYATNESKSGQMPSVQQCLQALECRLEQQGLDALPYVVFSCDCVARCLTSDPSQWFLQSAQFDPAPNDVCGAEMRLVCNVALVMWPVR